MARDPFSGDMAFSWIPVSISIARYSGPPKVCETLIADGGWRPWIYVKIETDQGVTGYGECTDPRSVSILTFFSSTLNDL